MECALLLHYSDAKGWGHDGFYECPGCQSLEVIPYDSPVWAYDNMHLV